MVEFAPGGWNANSTPLDVALTQLSVRETAPNRGPEVDEYLRSCGLDPAAGSYPWCVAFVRWCCSRVGVWLPRTAGVKKLWEMGEDLKVDKPEAGDVAVHLRPDGKGHVGFFMRHIPNPDGFFMRHVPMPDGQKDWVETVEGNTNGEGSRDGDRVAMKTRPPLYWNMGFLRPRRLS